MCSIARIHPHFTGQNSGFGQNSSNEIFGIKVTNSLETEALSENSQTQFHFTLLAKKGGN